MCDPLRMPRVSAEMWDRFFASMEEGNTPRFAAKEAGLDISNAYQKKSNDEAFSARWVDAYKAGTERLEQIATERAAAKSDALLKFLLQARDPDRFSQRHTLTGPNGGPVQFETGSSDIGL